MPTVDNTKWRGRDVDAEQDAESALSVVCSCVAWSFVPNGSRSACRRCRTRRAARVVGLVEPGPKRSPLGVERGGSHELDEEGSSVSLGTPRS